jgi:ankyrin repeat protein
MQQELRDLLDKNSERMLNRISAEESVEIKKAIAVHISEIEAASTPEAKRDLLDIKFGPSLNNILHLAAKFGDEDAVKRILALSDEFYVNVGNIDNFIALHFAAIGGYIEMVKALITAGCDQNAKASEKRRRWTPAHFAAKNNHVEVLEAFIKYGVDKEIKTGFGLTPLVVGAEFGHLKIVEYMLSIGAEKNVQTTEENHKMTALHYAVIGGFKDVVLLLLNAKVDREKETTFGMTAFEFAAKNNLVEMTSLLMTYGSSRSNKALKIAQENKSEDVVKQIIKYQKAKANLFSTKWLSEKGSELSNIVKSYELVNLGEAKIILEDGVVLNAFGIVSLTHEIGLFKKVTKTFQEFLNENGQEELARLLSNLKGLTSVN